MDSWAPSLDQPLMISTLPLQYFHNQICNSPYCQPYNSYFSTENLVFDQLIIPKLMVFFVLITYVVDIVLVLLGEILSWSLMGVKGLN